MELHSQEQAKSSSDQVILFMDHQQPPPPNPTRSLETELKDLAMATTKKSNSQRQTITITQTLRQQGSFTKPKARFAECKVPLLQKPSTETNGSFEIFYEDNEEEEDDDDEWNEEFDEYGEEGTRGKYHGMKRRKMMRRTIVEWLLFITILTCLICSLTISSIKHKKAWGLEIWRWCLMVMVIFSGRLVSGWVMRFLVFLITRNFMLKERVLYFVYGLWKSFQNCVWLGLVLLAWTFIFNARLHKKNSMVKKTFQFLVAVLIGATIWLIKIVLVKLLVSSFHVATYFDRMKESVFHHYILETLSGPPLDEIIEQIEKKQLKDSKSLPANWRDARNMHKSKKFGSRRIDMEKLKKLTESKASAWSVKRLVNYIRSSGLSTISKTVDDFGKAESEISSEWEARTCAQRIFKNVAKPGAKYIEEEDLMRFLTRVEVHTIFPLFEGALETGRITRSSFRNWVVRAYIERKALAHSLNDTKTAVQQLHKLASTVVSAIIVVEFLLVMGWATTNVIVLFTSQLLLVGFMFQNTCKTIFESIIFVFVMHPFDIGDRCVVEGVQMVVEEMNILTTVFLRYDNEKIYYPNSALLTKPISNFYRSPEMADAIEFSIDVSTPTETIHALKKSIQTYIESKPKHWSPKHNLLVKEIENVDKMKLLLVVIHTINHQNYGEKASRLSDLILELKKIFENLNIKYHLLPQEIHLTKVNAMT
ncbi:Mechanosensitive ion channel MscS [Dillenia turbinata]|uniref:Mechanosensitive ion channel protein n=1 Tax=Dillenia turbinata TaxID=194707 RepID=A0AAN8VSA6_9MAGN